MSEISKADQPFVDRLRSAAEKGAKAFVRIYPETVTRISERDTVYFHDPCDKLIRNAVEDKAWDDAKLLLRAYVEHGLAAADPNELVLSALGTCAIQTAMATNDDELFALAQNKMRHEEGPTYDFLFATASWYAAKGDKPKMYLAIMDTLKSYGVKPTEFTKSPAFAPYKDDPDFQLAAKGKYVVKPARGETASRSKQKSAAKKLPKGRIVWKTKPSKKAVHDTTKAFFDALAKGKIDAARPMLEHDYGFDENLSALYREMRSIDSSLKAKKWSADLAWLKRVKIGNVETDDGEPFDPDENPSFFVSISYKNQSTDVTADFEVRDADESYFLACESIQVM